MKTSADLLSATTTSDLRGRPADSDRHVTPDRVIAHRETPARRRLTDLPLKDCQVFLAEEGWEMRRVVARVQAYCWLNGLTPATWERFRQDLFDCGATDIALPG